VSGPFDAIVIGGGTNGLAAATALGWAGRRTLLLERADAIGGQSAMIEFAPDFLAPPLGLDAGWLPPSVARGLGIHAPALARAEPSLSLAIDVDDGLEISDDPSRAADAIRSRSEIDARRWPGFISRLRHLAGFLEALYQTDAPDIDLTGFAETRRLAGLGWRFRQLGRAGMTGLLRTLPMSIRELLDDTFEDEALKAAIAAGGVQGLRQGPRSGGTAFNLLHHLVGTPVGTIRTRGWWRDGHDALIRVLEQAAIQAKITIRTGATVEAITVKDDVVTGVRLESGEEIEGNLVLSSADPATTLLRLIDPVWLDPEFSLAVRNIRLRGSTSIVLFALDDLPAFGGLADSARALAGTLSLTPTLDLMEQAFDAGKYGELPERPHVELSAPTVRWPDLAPTGKHVLVARTTCSPFRLAGGQAWDSGVRSALADRVIRAVEDFSPGFGARVRHVTVLAPPDLEQRFGCTEGAFTHGELALDQILFMRPVAGWSRHAMPLPGLYLCGSGAHPGPGIAGGAGWLAARRALAG
jgi:phytoene dehydrogenase-like protein